MKKIFISLVAVAALAACSKSEVAYEQPQEIGFAVVKDNVTKAGGMQGTLENTQELGIWSYWDATATAGSVTNFGTYSDNYLVNALFAHNGSSWAGSPTGYPWPVNGALVFAGYTTPGDAVLPVYADGATTTAVSYNLATDVMKFHNYENTSEFDLCWFGRTASSYNYRAEGTAVEVELNHALTWVSVAVYGESATVGNWTITGITLKSVPNKGTATCTGSKATWETSASADLTAFSGTHKLTSGTITGDKTVGVKLTDNVIIPTTPVELTVTYKFLVNGVEKTDSKTVSLKLNENNTTKWESGVHYTYTLAFKANEILVAPSYGTWATADQSVTVE